MSISTFKLAGQKSQDVAKPCRATHQNLAIAGPGIDVLLVSTCWSLSDKSVFYGFTNLFT